MAILQKAKECTGTFICRFRVVLLIAMILLIAGILTIIFTTNN